MAKTDRPEWEVKVYGPQRSNVDIDLMTQIIMILGRQLSMEKLSLDEEEVSADGSAEQQRRANEQ